MPTTPTAPTNTPALIEIPEAIRNGIVAIRPDISDRITAAIATATAITTVDAATLATADAAYKATHDLEKLVEAERERIKRPVLEIGRKIDAAAKGASEDLYKARVNLGKRIAAFQAAEADRVRREKEAAEREAAAERKRQEEAERLRNEERDRKAKEAAQISAELGANFEPDPVQAPTYQPKTVVVTTAPPIRSTAVTTKKVNVLVIDDATQIPEEVGGVALWTLNTTAVDRLLRAGLVVPGARLEEREETAARR